MSENSVVNLSRFRADLSRAPSKRGKKLLEAVDLPQQVAALQPLEAYFIVKELGLEDAGEILRHCNHEQLQAFVDLDCWSNAKPDPIEIDAWLAVFSAESPTALARAFLSLEEELQILFLAGIVKVFDARSDDIPEAPKGATRTTSPDGFFILEPIPSRDREVDVLVLIDALFRLHPDEPFRLLTATQWEMKSELAETAYRFRAGRLQDMGFPPAEEAASIFKTPSNTPLPMPQQIASLAADESAPLPALYAGHLADTNLLTRALARITNPAHLDALERDLVYLINSALIAYGGSPKNLKNASATAERVRDTLALGLEHLLSPDKPLAFADGEAAADDAAKLLEQWPLRQVFSHGHHSAVALANDAQRLSQDPIIAKWLDVADADENDYSQDRLDRAFLRALAHRHPTLSGFDPNHADSQKAFASKKELAAAEQRLNALAERLL